MPTPSRELPRWQTERIRPSDLTDDEQRAACAEAGIDLDAITDAPSALAALAVIVARVGSFGLDRSNESYLWNLGRIAVERGLPDEPARQALLDRVVPRAL